MAKINYDLLHFNGPIKLTKHVLHYIKPHSIQILMKGTSPYKVACRISLESWLSSIYIALQLCRNVPFIGERRCLGDPAYKLVIILLLPSVLFIELILPFKLDLIRMETQISQFCGLVAC